MKNSSLLPAIKTVLVSAALLSASCSTSPHQASPLGACPIPDVELGAVDLSARTPKLVKLGNGKTCTITPTFQPDGEVQLELAIETLSADRTATRLNQTQFMARPNEHQTVNVGELWVGITPKLGAQ